MWPVSSVTLLVYPGAGIPQVCLPVSCCRCYLLEKWKAVLGVIGGGLQFFFLCLAWDSGQIFATLWSRKLFCLQARFVDARIFLFDPAPSLFPVGSEFSLLSFCCLGLGALSPLRGPDSEGEGVSRLCLRPECAGLSSLGLTEGLEVGDWQEREFMERPRFLGD